MKRCAVTWQDVVNHACERSAHPHDIHVCPCGACLNRQPELASLQDCGRCAMSARYTIDPEWRDNL